MPRPTKDEFINLLRDRTPVDIVNEHLLAGTPFAFANAPDHYLLFQQTLAQNLSLHPDNITIVGSGRLGYSLDPRRFGNPFSPDSSDIDTAVVNADLFDMAWHQLCSRGRSNLRLSGSVKQALYAHRTNNIFYGYIEPDRLTGALTIAPSWFRSFNALALVPELAGLDVNGRLYRTWDHLRYHQVYSLTGIKAELGIH